MVKLTTSAVTAAVPVMDGAGMEVVRLTTSVDIAAFEVVDIVGARRLSVLVSRSAALLASPLTVKVGRLSVVVMGDGEVFTSPAVATDGVGKDAVRVIGSGVVDTFLTALMVGARVEIVVVVRSDMTLA